MSARVCSCRAVFIRFRAVLLLVPLFPGSRKADGWCSRQRRSKPANRPEAISNGFVDHPAARGHERRLDGRGVHAAVNTGTCTGSTLARRRVRTARRPSRRATSSRSCRTGGVELASAVDS
jgi:hypothetical protein